MNAEILWVLKHVVGGYSDNSVTGSVDLFQSMFPDSKIASILELGKDKLKCCELWYCTLLHTITERASLFIKIVCNFSVFIAVIFLDFLLEVVQSAVNCETRHL